MIPAVLLDYLDRGWPIFPCRPDGSSDPKAPLTTHGFLDASTDHGEVADWLARWPRANWAIATGYPGPDVLDVEGPDKPGGSGFRAWNQLVGAGIVGGWSRLVETPSRGFHAYYPGTDRAKSAALTKDHHLDYQAVGAYVLAPPSVVNGKPYAVAEVRPSGGRLDWQACVDLLTAPREPMPWEKSRPAPVAERRRDGQDGRLTEIDLYNRGADWGELLGEDGWSRRGRYWCRPGKAAGHSASIGADGRLYVFSTSVEAFETRPDGRASGLSPFDYVTAARHGGDRRAALRELRAVRV